MGICRSWNQLENRKRDSCQQAPCNRFLLRIPCPSNIQAGIFHFPGFCAFVLDSAGSSFKSATQWPRIRGSYPARGPNHLPSCPLQSPFGARNLQKNCSAPTPRLLDPGYTEQSSGDRSNVIDYEFHSAMLRPLPLSLPLSLVRACSQNHVPRSMKPRVHRRNHFTRNSETLHVKF